MTNSDSYEEITRAVVTNSLLGRTKQPTDRHEVFHIEVTLPTSQEDLRQLCWTKEEGKRIVKRSVIEIYRIQGRSWVILRGGCAGIFVILEG